MDVKGRIKDSLLSQAIKQKLSMRHHVNVARVVGVNSDSQVKILDLLYKVNK